MNLRDAVDQFHRGYFATHRRSPRTQKAYAIDLRQFLDFIGDERPLTSLRPDDLEQWAAELKARQYAPASIRRKFAALRVFFHYWERREILDRSPLRHIRLDLPPTKKLVRILAAPELKKLLDSARHEFYRHTRRTGREPHVTNAGFLALRDLTIIEVLFATGVRVGELVALKLGDYQASEFSLTINGKGARQRMAFLLDSRSRTTFELYLHMRIAITVDTRALFLNTRGKALSTQGVASILATTARRARITQHITPHMLRHTIAVMLLNNGANLRVIQEFLGHASVTTTEKYTLVTKSYMIEALQNTHPNLG